MNPRLVRIQDWEGLARQAEFEPARMAALCPISLRQMERFFVQRFDKPPGEWARELQCRLAQHLVAQGYSTKAVAAELKFANESHFCHEFKKCYGVSPQTFAPIYGATDIPGATDHLSENTSHRSPANGHESLATSPQMSLLDNNVAFRQSIQVAGTP